MRPHTPACGYPTDYLEIVLFSSEIYLCYMYVVTIVLVSLNRNTRKVHVHVSLMIISSSGLRPPKPPFRTLLYCSIWGKGGGEDRAGIGGGAGGGGRGAIQGFRVQRLRKALILHGY